MKKSRSASVSILGIGATVLGFHAAVKAWKDLGKLNDVCDLGYCPANALPLAGQAGFPDSSGVNYLQALEPQGDPVPEQAAGGNADLIRQSFSGDTLGDSRVNSSGTVTHPMWD